MKRGTFSAKRQAQTFFPFPLPCRFGTFLGRPQRFLASVALEDGEEAIAYCANPGSFGELLKPGSRAILSDSGDGRRRRRFTLKAVKVRSIWVGTDTHMANQLAALALQAGMLSGISPEATFQREVRICPGCRLDFQAQTQTGSHFFEVKSATVVDNKIARFPDSITPRGVKHLRELTRLASDGHNAHLIFVVQRSDAKALTVVSDRDPDYACEYKKAVESGVKIHALGCRVEPEGVSVCRLLEVL